MKKSLFLAAVLALVSGCALLKDLAASAFQQPTITFKTARLADLSLGSATVDLVYQIDNPNPVGVSLAQVSYAFFIEGKQVVAGSPARGLQIPAGGQAEISFPANVKFADVAPVIQTFLTKETASYRAEGSLGVETPIGIVSLPLAQEGTFEVPKPPTVALEAPRITQFSFTGATIEVPITLTSNNSYDLPIGGLTGALQVSGARVGTLSTGDVGLLPARGSRKLSVPVTFHFAQATAAAAALSRGSGTIGFTGEIRSGPVAIPLSLSQPVTFMR